MPKKTMGCTRPRLISFGKNQGIFQITYYFLFSLPFFFSQNPLIGHRWVLHIFLYSANMLTAHTEEIVPLAKSKLSQGPTLILKHCGVHHFLFLTFQALENNRRAVLWVE
ncbi:hypothetical protein PanWU01x14_177830 [Parasponia andersonii]|uniref:Uncharacterized protein n=1 Tax=Parasponia andersonii TaxID=3476 RepID=A0A2P5C7A6_PARAD|nr:hypothetical protein PanWU01x14_177830 [Parasponia andersonii]